MEKTFAHSVFFWLRTDLAQEDRLAFEKGVSTLTKTPGVIFSQIGAPAAGTRDVVDYSYDYNLLLVFENASAQDTYQKTDATHQQFIATCRQYWEKVLIYDNINIIGEVM